MSTQVEDCGGDCGQCQRCDLYRQELEYRCWMEQQAKEDQP